MKVKIRSTELILSMFSLPCNKASLNSHNGRGLFQAALLEVPFVDPIGTLADPALGLTVHEWGVDEFGDPHLASERHVLETLNPCSNSHKCRSVSILLRPAFKVAFFFYSMLLLQYRFYLLC